MPPNAHTGTLRGNNKFRFVPSCPETAGEAADAALFRQFRHRSRNCGFLLLAGAAATLQPG